MFIQEICVILLLFLSNENLLCVQEVAMLLRDYLIEHGLTHEEFASLVGVTRPAVSYWLRGQTRPNPTSAVLIARVTKGAVTAQDLQHGWEMNQ